MNIPVPFVRDPPPPPAPALRRNTLKHTFFKYPRRNSAL